MRPFDIYMESNLDLMLSNRVMRSLLIHSSLVFTLLVTKGKRLLFGESVFISSTGIEKKQSYSSTWMI